MMIVILLLLAAPPGPGLNVTNVTNPDIYNVCSSSDVCSSLTINGTLVADAGSFDVLTCNTSTIVTGTLIADAGSFGGPVGAIHAGMIAGAAAPTCGIFTGLANLFDGGTSCVNSSTDMSGTISALAGNTTNQNTVTTGPYLWMKPGAAFTSQARCTFTPSDATSASIQYQPFWELDAGVMQMYFGTATQFDAGAPAATWDWICLGQ